MIILGLFVLIAALGVAKVWAEAKDEAIYVENWNPHRADNEK